MTYKKLITIFLIYSCLLGCKSEDVIPVQFEAKIDGQSWQASDIKISYTTSPNEVHQLQGISENGSSITIDFNFLNLYRFREANFRSELGESSFVLRELHGLFDKEKNQILISWETVSEENVASFSLEFSPDGENWESIENIDAKGDINTSSFYELQDKNDYFGLKYYRISSVDEQGIFGQVSPIIAIFNTDYPAIFESESKFKSPGYDGSISVDFNASLNKVSGHFHFWIKNEHGQEIEVSDGKFFEIDI